MHDAPSSSISHVHVPCSANQFVHQQHLALMLYGNSVQRPKGTMEAACSGSDHYVQCAAGSRSGEADLADPPRHFACSTSGDGRAIRHSRTPAPNPHNEGTGALRTARHGQRSAHSLRLMWRWQVRHSPHIPDHSSPRYRSHSPSACDVQNGLRAMSLLSCWLRVVCGVSTDMKLCHYLGPGRHLIGYSRSCAYRQCVPAGYRAKWTTCWCLCTLSTPTRTRRA